MKPTNSGWGGVSTMLLKRYFRISIPIAAVLVFIALSYYGGFQYNQSASILNGNERLSIELVDMSFCNLILDMFLIPLRPSFGWMSQAWMIQYIFLGSFLSVFMCMATDGMRQTRKVIFSSFIAVLFYNVDIYYVCIVTGYLLYQYIPTLNNMKGNIKTLIATVTFALFILLRFLVNDSAIGHIGRYGLLFALLVVIMVFHSGLLQKFLSTVIMRWLGKISFSLYLWHMMLLCTMTSWLYIQTFVWNPYLQCIFLLISSTTILLILSAISQKYIEDKVCSNVINRIVTYLTTK